MPYEHGQVLAKLHQPAIYLAVLQGETKFLRKL